MLVFLDTGAVAGPQFLRNHLAAHQDRHRPQVCLGYTYGYNPEEPMPGLAEVLDRYTPEQAVRALPATTRPSGICATSRWSPATST